MYTPLYIGNFFFSSRRRHTRLQGDWSSDVCSSDLQAGLAGRNCPDAIARWSECQTRGREQGGQIGRARLNSSHLVISYAVFCLKKKKKIDEWIFFYKKKNESEKK